MGKRGRRDKDSQHKQWMNLISNQPDAVYEGPAPRKKRTKRKATKKWQRRAERRLEERRHAE